VQHVSVLFLGAGIPKHFLRLAAHEQRVLQLLAYSNKEIAARLLVTEGTVKAYVSAMLSQLGTANRTELALWAAEHRECLLPDTWIEVEA